MTSNINNTPVVATTVLLIRDSGNGLEVFMVTRHHKIDFAYGALVFPGGKLDDNDSDPELIDLCSKQHPGVDNLAARICGIRETFEEAGVLLARDSFKGDMISSQRCAELQITYRELLHKGSVTLLEIVRKENLELACDQLTPFARWITPSSFSRRFDALFYLVETPINQIASHDSVESIGSVWSTPSDALKKADEGRVTLVFATRMNLQKLGKYDDVTSAVHAAKKHGVIPVEPLLHEKDGTVTYTIPIEAGYGITKFTEYGGPSLKIRSET
ncbi:NUDIX hydrolase [Gammaproteobacteria bacterium]|nr:NUDIX hydrolase [Gammaproteobacteria bacterium]